MHNEKLLSCNVSLNMGSFKWTALGRRFQQHVRDFPQIATVREPRPALKEAVQSNLYQWKKNVNFIEITVLFTEKKETNFEGIFQSLNCHLAELSWPGMSESLPIK